MPEPDFSSHESRQPAISMECEEAHLSRAEIAAEIRQIAETPALRDRLDLIANHYSCLSIGIAAWELRNEAIARALDQKRLCPRSVKVIAFLAQTMRSIASSEIKYLRRFVDVSKLPLARSSEDSGDEVIEWDVADDRPTPDREVVASQALQTIIEASGDDQAALALLDGIEAGLDGEKLRMRLGLSKTAYDTLRKRFRRRNLRLFPDGWKP